MDILSPTMLLIALTFALAGFVKGVIGLGLPTISMGLLALVMPTPQAAAVLVVPSIVTNFWQMFDGPALREITRRLWPLLVGICLGTWSVAGLMTSAPSTTSKVILGLAIAGYGLLGLSAVRFHVSPALERWLAFPVGLATGLLAAGTGVFVIPSVPYLQALEMGRDRLVQALAVSFTVSTLALVGNLVAGKIFSLEIAALSAFALLPALAGMALGQFARTRMSETAFRRVFFASLVALGGYIAWAAVK
jgi:uncharacterized membrane protein YfcA